MKKYITRHDRAGSGTTAIQENQWRARQLKLSGYSLGATVAIIRCPASMIAPLWQDAD